MKCSIRNSQRSNNRLTDSPRLRWTHLNSWHCWVTLIFLCCLDLLFDLFFNRKVRSSIFSCLFFLFFCHLCKRSQCFSLAWTEDQNSYYFQSPHFVHLPEETFLCSSAVNMQYSNLSLLTPKETIFIFTETVIFFFPVCFFCARLLILVTQNAAFTSSCKKTATPSSAKTERRRCFAGWVKAQQVHQSAW